MPHHAAHTEASALAWPLLAGAATLALVACAGRPPAAAGTNLVTAASCAALMDQDLGGARVTAAAFVAPVAATGAQPAMPSYCKVSARVLPKLNFEVRLPANWNGKLHYSGGGGFNGAIPPVDASALNQGYVDVSSDSGHTGPGIDASFADGDPLALRLFSELSVPTVTAAARSIVRSTYGKEPTRSYFEGCSNGGREGLMTALRFPTLFDGVIAKAPARYFIGAGENYQRTARALRDLPGGTISAAKLKSVSDAVLAKCDALDGVADGLIANIGACKFDVSTLRCPSGGDEGDACLSDPQLKVFTTLTSRMTGGPGTPFVTSFPPFALYGQESAAGSWGSWLLGSPSITGQFTESMVRHLLSTDPNVDWVSFDYQANAPIVRAMANEIDVGDPDLLPFKSTGGKLILWHGASDMAVPLQATIDYYGAVARTVGGQGAADSFMRFYVAPGVLHCRGGAGADQSTQLLPALDAWVTQGSAPADLTSQKTDASGAVAFTRPLCRYPSFAKYKGSGNVNDAANYACAAS